MAAGAPAVSAANEIWVCRLVRALHDVLCVDRWGVVIAERSLDAALGLGGVRRREAELGGEQHARTGGRRRQRGGQPGDAGADHEHVAASLGHGERLIAAVPA